jgi:hypothetical protein
VVVVVVVGAAVVLVVVVGAAVVLVVVVGATVVVVVVVGLQHSYPCTFHLPTLGLFFLHIRELETALPEPSKRTKALSLLLFAILCCYYCHCVICL